MNRPQVVSEQEWQAARNALLVKEKECTRALDWPQADENGWPQDPTMTWLRPHDEH